MPTSIDEGLHYEDGNIIRNGRVAGFYDRSCGYMKIKIKNKTYLVHRIIFYLHHRYFPRFIDHIDRNKLNNRIENLRATEKKQNNTVNTEKRSDNTSGFKGVTWHKTSKKWHSSVFKDNKRYYLGVYENKADAAKAYNVKAKELFGDFAYLNEV